LEGFTLRIKKIKFFLAISVSLLSIVPETFASNHSPNREGLLFMYVPVVTTATRTSISASKAPATVRVITAEQIKDRGYSNLLDLMKDLPGVDVQDRNGEEMFNYVLIRGIKAQEKFIIMQDGHRISSPTGERIPLAENFPLYNARHVEIVYGPASALYGADAFAGVINIITKDAEDIGGWEASVSAGNFGYQKHLLNYGNKLSRNIKLSAGGHWNESDNADLRKYYGESKMVDLYWDHDHDSGTPKQLLVAAGDRNFDMTTESHSAYLKLDINDAFTLGYNRSFFRHPAGQGGVPDYALYDRDVTWETLINNYYADYRFGDDESVGGTTSFSYLTYEVGPDSKFINKFVNFEDIAYKYAESNRFKLEQQLNFKLNDSNLLVAGATFEDFYSLPKTSDLSHPYDPDKAASDQGIFYGGTSDTIPVDIYELRYNNYGIYLQLQSELSSRISTTMGVRFDDNSRYGSNVNPRGGIVFTPRETTTIKLLYGEAYQAPSPYDSYAGYGAFSGGPDGDGDYTGGFFRLPNPDLKPEKLRTYELGLEEMFSDDFTVKAVTFYTEIDEMIAMSDWNFTTSTYIEGGKVNPWKRNENRAESYYYGGELSADYNTSVDLINLNFWGNYSYLNGRENLEGEPKTEHPYISKHKFKVGMTATAGKFYVTPVVRWIGQANNERIKNPSNNNQRVPSYTIINLNLGANDILKGLSAAINIQNLFDKRYYNTGSGSGTHQSMPQEPRQIVAKLSYKF